MKVLRLEPDISLIDLDPPIPGFDGFLGTYVIQSDKLALLDVGPASSLPNLLSGLNKLNIDPKDVDFVLCSHIHLDHTGGLGQALKYMPKAMGIVHEKGKPHLINPARLWKGSLEVLGDLATDYGEPEPIPEQRLVSAEEANQIDLGAVQLRVVITPGHASHHISFFEHRTRRLFAGEAAGINLPLLGGVLPATPNPFDLIESMNSVNKMIALNPGKIFYAHLGSSENAIIQLNLFKQQLILWGRIIANHINDNCEWQEILKEIIRNNPPLGKIFELSAARQKFHLDRIRSSIDGYRDYLKKAGVQVLDMLESSKP